MSIILDALKKAQEERKKITQMGFPKIGSKKSSKNQKLAFYIVAGSLVCLIFVVLFYPAQKKPVQIQTAAVKNPPVVVTPVNPPQSPPSKKGDEGVLQSIEPSPVKVETKVNVPASFPQSASLKKVVDEQVSPNPPPPPLKKGDEGGLQRYVSKKRPPSKKRLEDTRAKMLPQEDAKVVLKKVDDEKIMNAFNEAVEESKNGRLEIAKDLYLSILQEKPDYVEALNNLGVISMKQDNMNEALTYFRKCLGYKKDYAKAYNNIGLVMMTQGDKKAAEEYFSKSIEVDKDKLEPYLNLAAIMREEKRYDEASRLLESLVNRQVKNASVYLSLALIKDEMGKHNDAIQYYRNYLGMGGGREERNKVVNRLKTLEENKAAKNIRE